MNVVGFLHTLFCLGEGLSCADDEFDVAVNEEVCWPSKVDISNLTSFDFKIPRGRPRPLAVLDPPRDEKVAILSILLTRSDQSIEAD